MEHQNQKYKTLLKDLKKDIQEENINLDINFNILMAEIILK